MQEIGPSNFESVSLSERSDKENVYPTEIHRSPFIFQPFLDECTVANNESAPLTPVLNCNDSSSSAVHEYQNLINNRQDSNEKKPLVNPFFDVGSDAAVGGSSLRNNFFYNALEATTDKITRVTSLQVENDNTTANSAELSSKYTARPTLSSPPRSFETSESVKPQSSLGKRFRQLNPTLDDW